MLIRLRAARDPEIVVVTGAVDAKMLHVETGDVSDENAKYPANNDAGDNTKSAMYDFNKYLR